MTINRSNKNPYKVAAPNCFFSNFAFHSPLFFFSLVERCIAKASEAKPSLLSEPKRMKKIPYAALCSSLTLRENAVDFQPN